MQVAVAILGFSDFERDALSFCIRNALGGPARYELVEALIEAELVVADADAPGVIERIVLAARTPHVVFVGKTGVPGANAVLPRPIDPGRVLRSLDELGAEVLRERIVAWAGPDPEATVVAPVMSAVPDDLPQPGAFDAPAAHAAPAQGAYATVRPPAPPPYLTVTIPTLMDLAEPAPVLPPVPVPAPVPVPMYADLPTVPSPPPARQRPRDDARMAARAKTRAAVRHARQAGVAEDSVAPADVLLYDDRPDDRAALAALLELFGFVVHAAEGLDHALRLVADKQTTYAAVFLDVALDGSDGDDGIGLCRRVKARQDAPVLVLVSRSAGAADHVRAMLAGVDAQIDKPATRGAVARTLEDRGVRLPADARRA